MDEKSLILHYDKNLQDNIIKYKCTICNKNCLDKTMKDKHEISCKKRQLRYNLTDEEMKQKYKKKNKEVDIEENKIESDNDIDIDNIKNDISNIKDDINTIKNIIINDKKKDIIQNTTNNITNNIINNCYQNIENNVVLPLPFVFPLNTQNITTDDINGYIVRPNFDQLIDKLLENPLNHNILLNDIKLKEVVLFHSIDEGFKKMDITDVLEKYNQDGKLLLRSNLHDPTINYSVKNILLLELNKLEKQFDDNLKKSEYIKERYMKIKSIIPTESDMYKRFHELQDKNEQGLLQYKTHK